MAALYITQASIEAGAKALYEESHSEPWEYASVSEISETKQAALKVLTAAAEHLHVGPEVHFD
jgi:hypothetical protein